MKLTSSKNFGKSLKDKTDSEYRRLRDNFDHFLDQSLHLGMLVPCDEEGNILEEPKGWNDEDCKLDDCCNVCKCEQYKQAKERVLFEGFEFKNDLIFNASNQTFIDEEIIFNLENIENLINYYDDLTLTKTAIKQIGL
ncbi:hypothetical protein [Empedobacter brevis]|uniref:hypothetical protein n=1 Tax=Empedobacter brevis TaxID=247 RepID=UPI0023F4EB97|nr:hypothetical protein [Empedobacter brevis]